VLRGLPLLLPAEAHVRDPAKDIDRGVQRWCQRALNSAIADPAGGLE